MKAAVIVAGGSATRMNSTTPKQFLLLKNKPVLAYSLTAFYRFEPSMKLLVALPAHLFDPWKELQKTYGINIPHELVPGGETRFHSVFNCLQHLTGEGLVAIHDAARPLVSVELIQRLFAAAESSGNAIPVVPVNESLRKVSGASSQPADRSIFRIVQTPQVFCTTVIQQAYMQPNQPGFTDDSTVLESTGRSVHLVEGDPVNFKITYPDDLMIADALLGSRQ